MRGPGVGACLNTLNASGGGETGDKKVPVPKVATKMHIRKALVITEPHFIEI